MPAAPDQPFTLGFLGFADPSNAALASAYEDEVLALLGQHGARLLYRGRRVEGQDPSLPHELHLIRFPDRGAFERYLADDRRAALRRRHGEVFTSTMLVELERLDGDGSTA